MRILHVLDHSAPLQSGYVFRTNAILKHQRRLGWETDHVTSSKHYVASAPEEHVDGLHFYRTLMNGSRLARLPVLNQYAVIRSLSQRLREVVHKRRPDILHAHSPCLNGVAALRIGREARIPVVYELRASWEDAAVNHGTTREGSLRYRVSRALETYVLRRANAVTTICEGLLADILDRGITAERVTVIPNAVDVDAFRVGGGADVELRHSLGLDGKRVIGFIGSFYDYEGLDILIQAAPQLSAAMPDIAVLLVGGGPQESFLKSLAAARGVSDRVLFAGRVPHADVKRYYDVIDVLVYPRRSIRLTETVTPLKPLEAMAEGRLLVASDVGGHRELIRDGETGTLFESDNPRALADAVCKLLAAPTCWEARLRAAREFVETERTWARIVPRYAPVYESLIINARGSRQWCAS
ncbi:MAG: TIGR04063 family PEP-CTERM/XrtA system glycosyltransferase [Gammaproteobacteria bacterium]